MNKKILIGITGGIAAYKIADLVSDLTKAGHEVKCVVTENARRFVSPLVLETLSGNPVSENLFGLDVQGTEHINLARWPELILIAPASANSIAKMAHGLADDLLSTIVLATRSPILFAPSMNTAMWENPATQANCAALTARGFTLIAPDAGVLACQEVGEGKLPSIQTLRHRIDSFFESTLKKPVQPTPQDLSSEQILITAGPTVSYIDAVRYMTNPSTGLMGARLAEAALERGAQVFYVLGKDKGVIRPQIKADQASRFELVEVETAEEMLAAALSFLPRASGIIATAAVLDYKVHSPSASKQKRLTDGSHLSLELSPSVDVLNTLCEKSKKTTWKFGFAAETDDVKLNGLKKPLASCNSTDSTSSTA